MSKIKYKKGDYVIDVFDGEKYLYKVIKNIPLSLWENNSEIRSNYVEYIGDKEDTDVFLYSKKRLDNNASLKQYKANYINTALYKLLYKER